MLGRRAVQVFLLLALAASIRAGCIHSGQTRNLVEETFDDHVAKSDHLITFVEFSSPWCIWAHPNTNGHGDCAEMRQAWDKLGGKYNSSRSISVAEVDCSRFVTHTDEEGVMRSKESLCQRFGIKSYPTVFVFNGATGVNGTLYKGKQTYEAMDAYLEEQQATLCLISEDAALEPNEQCGEDQKKFLATWKQKSGEAVQEELDRLEKIQATREVNFGATKRAWMGKRVNVLKQIRFVQMGPRGDPDEVRKEEL